MRTAVVLLLTAGWLGAQEAGSGFEVRATFAVEASNSRLMSASPRNDGNWNGGFRSVLYPTWKISSHWAVAGAVQVYSRPFFYEELTTQGRGVRGDVLQAHLSYSRFWKNRSFVVRVGELSSAFGAFLLRYDDMVNPLIDMPPAYGYYYKGITTRGLLGAQAETSLGKADFRLQFVNSSPANRRGIFDSEQYGSWAGGGGYTITQGFRVGASAYRGPYLHRQYAYYFPGEARPRDLPGAAQGIDVQFARGHWNINGELQRFQMDYIAIPTFRQNTGYAEVRRVLHPRWYVASRAAYVRANAFPGFEVYDFVVGYRPNRLQLIKTGYQLQHGLAFPGTSGNTFTVQLVTSFTALSIARE